MNAQTDPTTPDPEAPFGYKADGTPRKRAAPTWQNDPVRKAAAAAKRSKPKRAGGAPAVTAPQATELLVRVRREIDERLAELEPLAREYQELEVARDALAE